ncbi:hypothetical protein LTR51_005064 [Lithohypha guttulata]|uniref:Uncharacterized protein n=1 Tax=Lithohypha guttulata TaxID=1690604 RepID=A0AAN7T2Y2_9EURO|nr:hypothetical protein LTR51_005064 [Lithohypha guttulata]KAK5087813.1 hypothetical protein LTR05_002028 [Lithohypha guttulata]
MHDFGFVPLAMLGLLSLAIASPLQSKSNIDLSNDPATSKEIQVVDNEVAPQNEISAEASIPSSCHISSGPEIGLYPGNDYAMVCIDDKGCTMSCQGTYGYYCDSRVKLKRDSSRNKDSLPICEEFCECINLNPAPKMLPICAVDYTGKSYCTSGNKNARRDLAIPSDSDIALVGNDFALVCFRDKVFTVTCQGTYGYYCDARGSLKRDSSAGQEKARVCERILHGKELLRRGKGWKRDLAIPANSDVALYFGNNYAMVCEWYCECVNLNPAPKIPQCYVDYTGKSYCV